VPRHGALLTAALLIVCAACERAPLEEAPADLPLTPADALVPARPAPSLLDDADPASLRIAVGRSLEWLERLPPDSLLDFGVRRVSAGTLRTSMDELHGYLAEGPGPAALAAWVAERFEVVQSVGAAEPGNRSEAASENDGGVLFTGYYEPIIPGARQRTDRATVPVYGPPGDLVRMRLSAFDPELPDRTLTGRVDGGAFVPYWTRNEIQADDALADRGLEIAWVEDRVDLFFVEVQGSGAIRFPDGGELGISYAAANGRPYRSIGRLLIDDGLVPEEEMSMQAIRSYLAEQPDDVARVLDYNESFVFFRTRTTPPVGALGVPVTPGRSIATDLSLFPRGALAFIETTRPALDSTGAVVDGPPLGRFMLNQDTGGAIRGAGRVDVFWGRGEDAAETAGRMQQSGRLFFLLPREAVIEEGLDVVVLSDLNSSYGSTEYEPEVARTIARLTDEWRPDLVLIAGDVVAGQKPDLSDAEVAAMWAAFDSVVSRPLRRAGIGIGFTPGNHDASGHPAHARDRRLAAEYWAGADPGVEVIDGGRFPFHYAFTRDGVFFLVLDASTGDVVADTAQMAWIRRALTSPEAREAGLRIALGHLPLYPVAAGRDRPGEFQADGDLLRRVLEAGDVAMYISGHHHAYYPGQRGDLALLYAGALGQGARSLLGPPTGSSGEPFQTVTRLRLLPALGAIEERTWRVGGERPVPVDPLSVPERIEGSAGVVVRRAGSSGG
jgi:membrane-bound lytic murein transglycosylase A